MRGDSMIPHTLIYILTASKPSGYKKKNYLFKKLRDFCPPSQGCVPRQMPTPPLHFDQFIRGVWPVTKWTNFWHRPVGGWPVSLWLTRNFVHLKRLIQHLGTHRAWKKIWFLDNGFSKPTILHVMRDNNRFCPKPLGVHLVFGTIRIMLYKALK